MARSARTGIVPPVPLFPPRSIASFAPMRLPLTLALLILAVPLRAENWPCWRGPNRTGIVAEVIRTDWPAEGPAQVWKANVGVGFSSVVVAKGRVFTMGYVDGQDRVQALDVTSGKSLWTHAYDEPLAAKMYEGGPNSTPLVAADRVITTSKTGHVFALNVTDGKVIWETELKKAVGAKLSDWGVSGAPFLLREQVILPYGPRGVALDLAKGRVIWDSGKNEDNTYATPVLGTFAGQETILLIMSKALLGVDPVSGVKRWSSDFGQGFHFGRPASRPTVTARGA